MSQTTQFDVHTKPKRNHKIFVNTYNCVHMRIYIIYTNKKKVYTLCTYTNIHMYKSYTQISYIRIKNLDLYTNIRTGM